jgi:hypothetical protein
MTGFAIAGGDLRALLPELVLVAGGVLLLLVDAFRPQARRWRRPRPRAP